MPENQPSLFQCDQCKRKFVWKPQLAGMTVRCKCGQPLAVPASVEEMSPIEPPPVPARPPVIRTLQPTLPVMAQPQSLSPALAYATPVKSSEHRPGILIAIGIISILVGLISIVASGVMAAVWWSFYAGSVAETRPLMPGDPRLMLGLFIYCLAVVFLASYLIACGITTLIRPAAAARLHVVYAGTKLVFIAIEIALSLGYFATVTSSTTHAIRPFDTRIGLGGLIMTTIVQSIYPLSLILVLLVNRKLWKVPLRGHR